MDQDVYMRTVAIVKRNFTGFTGAVRTMQEHIRCFREMGYNVDIYGENIDDKMVTEIDATAYRIGFWPLVGNRGRPYFNWRTGRLINAKNYDLVFDSSLSAIVYELIPAFGISFSLVIVVSLMTTPPDGAEEELSKIATRYGRSAAGGEPA